MLIFRPAALTDFVLACTALKVPLEVYRGHRLVQSTISPASVEQRKKVSATDLPWVQLAAHLVDAMQ